MHHLGWLEPFSNNNNNNNTLLSHFVFYFRIHNTLGTNAFIDRPSHIRLLIVTSRDGRTFLLGIRFTLTLTKILWKSALSEIH